MNKNTIWSFVHIVIFLILFLLMTSGISLGSFGRVMIIWMVLSPIFGFVHALKGGNWIKWVLMSLNIIAFIIILSLLLLGFGMGEA
ncbi:hypothetical protein [Bacillus seohaeanensis]|jgi:hypothetical protein|uniref:Uncharacterized protein n=1 Tax=Bacillus seohaeanensis TaxID=284580 RepID=A0ABW5RW04_9BACI